MNKSVQKKAWIGIVLSVLFYSVIVLFSDVEKIINQFNNIKLEYYVIIFPLIFFGYVVLSLRFNLLLKKLNINISYRNSFLIHLTGGSMAITPGGLGAVIKSHILKEKMGKSFSSTVPVTIFEKWIDLTGIIITIGILIFWINFLESIIIFSIGLIFMPFVYLLFKKKFGYSFLKRILSKIKFLQRFMVNFDEAQSTSNVLFSKRTALEALPFTLLHKLFVIVAVYLIFQSFGLDLDPFLTGQIYYTSSLIGALSFIPGGIIVVDASLLGLILKHGIDLSIASSLVLTIRFVTLWFHTIIGFIALKIAFNKKTLPSTDS